VRSGVWRASALACAATGEHLLTRQSNDVAVASGQYDDKRNGIQANLQLLRIDMSERRNPFELLDELSRHRECVSDLAPTHPHDCDIPSQGIEQSPEGGQQNNLGDSVGNWKHRNHRDYEKRLVKKSSAEHKHLILR
jgi:hypothetical protein